MKIDPTSEIRLASGVFFKKIGDRVYARNVETHYEYLYNASAFDVLECARNGTTLPKLVECIMNRYIVASKDAAQDMLMPFIERLLDTGMVSTSAVESPVRVRHGVAEYVEQHCFDKKRLWSVILELTYRCNERCRHCYLDIPDEVNIRSELTTAEYKRVIDELNELGCMSVLVTGGEPTLRTDFLEICEYVVSKGMLLDVFTNALKITDECFDKLVGMHVNSISFSLYGGNAEFHDYITKIPGSFETSLRNIMAFKCAGVDIYVKTVLFSGHLDELVALRKLCKRLKLRLTVSQFIIPGHSGKDQSEMMFSEEEYRQYLEIEKTDAMPGASRYMGEVRDTRDMNGPICKAGHTALSIDPKGDVFACNSVPNVLGNVRTESLKDIWTNSSELKKIRAFRFGDISPECHSCKHSGACVFCLGAALRENHGELGPCKLTCRNARLRHEILGNVSDAQ